MNSLKLLLSNRMYFSAAWVFASINILTGTWVLYLPYVKEKFELNDSEIGISLFCLALGLLISIPFVPIVNRKIGVGRATKFGILLYAIVFNFPLLAPTFVTLCLCLFLVGIFSGFTDVSVNTLVSTIEKKYGDHIMSISHGFFSLGGFIGAGVGSFLIGGLIHPHWHMLVVSLIIIGSNLYLSSSYKFIEEYEISATDNGNRMKYLRPLMGLSIVAFIIMLNEGAIEHWSNLFLHDIVQVSKSKAGLGFVAFSLFMTVGRIYGDQVSKRFGSTRIIIGGCLIAIAGYTFILTANLLSSVFGFGLVGLGLSVIIPEIFRMAGNTEGIKSSIGISIVSGIGFAGFLIGPVFIGLISNYSNLTYSFGFLVLLVGIVLVVCISSFRKNG